MWLSIYYLGGTAYKSGHIIVEFPATFEDQEIVKVSFNLFLKFYLSLGVSFV